MSSERLSSAMESADSEKNKVITVDLFGNRLELECNWNVGIGGSTWTSGHLVLDFLQNQPSEMRRKWFESKRVIEVGSGTGLVGLGISMLPAKEIVLTDLPSHIPALEVNLNRNKKLFCCENVHVHALTWGQNDETQLMPPYDVIIGTDVAYQRELYEPLIATFNALSHEETKIILGFNRSDTDILFFRRLVEEGFDYCRIPERMLGDDLRGKGYGIFIISKQFISLDLDE